MQTIIEPRGDVIVVRISGSMDGTTADALLQVLSAELAGGRYRLVADLQAVEYTSSAGLRVILSTLKDARAGGGDLRLAAPRREVKKVLDLSGYTTILKIFDDLEAAVTSFGA